jgi:hypothetical protein
MRWLSSFISGRKIPLRQLLRRRWMQQRTQLKVRIADVFFALQEITAHNRKNRLKYLTPVAVRYGVEPEALEAALRLGRWRVV